MGKFRKIDTTPGRVNRQVADLKKALAQERSAARLASSEVAEGGSTVYRGILSVIGLLDMTGELLMKSALGDVLIRMGDMVYGDRGVQFFRETGTKAFELAQGFAGTPQRWALFDDVGNEVVSEQTLFGGIHSPFLEMPFQPFSATSGTTFTCGPYGIERTHNTTTWTTLFVHSGKRQNQGVHLRVAAKCSDGTTAAELRVVNQDTGVQLGSFILSPWVGVVPTGTTSFLTLNPNTGETMLADIPVHSQMRLGLQCRRTAGTGTITVSVMQAIGG